QISSQYDQVIPPAPPLPPQLQQPGQGKIIDVPPPNHNPQPRRRWVNYSNNVGPREKIMDIFGPTFQHQCQYRIDLVKENELVTSRPEIFDVYEIARMICFDQEKADLDPRPNDYRLSNLIQFGADVIYEMNRWCSHVGETIYV